MGSSSGVPGIHLATNMHVSLEIVISKEMNEVEFFFKSLLL